MLCVQSCGDELADPGEAEDEEDPDEGDHLAGQLPPLLSLTSVGGAVSDTNMNQEQSVDDHGDEEDALLVDEDGGGEVGDSISPILGAQVTIVDTHLWGLEAPYTLPILCLLTISHPLP